MNTRFVVSVGGLALAAAISTTQAQVLFQDNFNGANDAAWTEWAGDANGPPPASFTFPLLSPGNYGYRMQDWPGTSSYFTTARVGSYVTGLSMTDAAVMGELV